VNFKLKEKVRIASTLYQLANDDFDVVIKLPLLAFNIKKEVCGVLDSFLSFLRRHEKKSSQFAFIDVRIMI